MNKIRIGIDASRCKSGGAIKHLINILRENNIDWNVVKDIHVWCYGDLAAQLSDIPGVVCHVPKALSSSIIYQLLWQAFALERELSESGCAVLFTADASSLCRFKPMVTLSQDLLAYEPGISKHIRFGLASFRLSLIRYFQGISFQHSDVVIALTNYAARTIRESANLVKPILVVEHGVDKAFSNIRPRSWRAGGQGPVRCLYVSPIAGYKFHSTVVKAICGLRELGRDIELVLAGDGSDRDTSDLRSLIKQLDPLGRVVQLLGHVRSEEVVSLVADADVFVFASGCESFGITLLEGMAAGLPIACSDRSSLPETLKDGGLYFDPEDPKSLAAVILRLLDDESLRFRLGSRAKELSQAYGWERCSSNTFRVIVDVAQKYHLRTDNGVTWHNDIADKWSIKYKQSKGFEERLSIFRNLISRYAKRGGTALDLGCGSGIMLPILAEYFQHVVGVDASEKMLENCGKHLEGLQGCEVELVLSDLKIINTTVTGKGDMLISSSVFEYIDNLDHMLRICADKLQPGGHLIFSIPNKSGFYRKLEKLIFNITGHPRYLRHVRNSLKCSEAVELTERAGLDVVEVRFFTKTPFLPSFLSEVLINELFVLVATKRVGGL